MFFYTKTFRPVFDLVLRLENLKFLKNNLFLILIYLLHTKSCKEHCTHKCEIAGVGNCFTTWVTVLCFFYYHYISTCVVITKILEIFLLFNL